MIIYLSLIRRFKTLQTVVLCRNWTPITIFEHKNIHFTRAQVQQLENIEKSTMLPRLREAKTTTNFGGSLKIFEN